MKKQIALLIVLLLTACAPQQPPNAEEQLATIAVKTQEAALLGTIVAETLTSQPPKSTPLPIVSATPVLGADVIPTGDAALVSDLLACGPSYGLAYFRIPPEYRRHNWQFML